MFDDLVLFLYNSHVKSNTYGILIVIMLNSIFE